MALPLSFLLNYSIYVKSGLVIIGLVYILVVLFKFTDSSFSIRKDIDWHSFLFHTLKRFIIIAIVTTLFVWSVDASKLFYVPLNNLGLYVLILGIYTFLSVWPQEVIYRTFFFQRYGDFFTNSNLLLLSNAVLFSVAHIFFKNLLVLMLTFIGGLLFAWTYYKTKSTTLVSIEHALYGNWLFTVGMGDMLAFPGIETS